MNSVSKNGHTYTLRPETYYHLPSRQWFSYLNDTVNLGEGLALTKSAFERVGLSRTDTPYQLYQGGTYKERLWEEIRITGFSGVPTRVNALFLFEDWDMAKRARNEWSPNEQRDIVPVRVLSKPYASFHIADSQWLNKEEDQWGSAARSYWCSKRTCDPIMEVVVQGWVYSPHWRQPPFDTVPEPYDFPVVRP